MSSPRSARARLNEENARLSRENERLCLENERLRAQIASGAPVRAVPVRATTASAVPVRAMSASAVSASATTASAATAGAIPPVPLAPRTPPDAPLNRRTRERRKQRSRASFAQLCSDYGKLYADLCAEFSADRLPRRVHLETAENAKAAMTALRARAEKLRARAPPVSVESAREFPPLPAAAITAAPKTDEWTLVTRHSKSWGDRSVDVGAAPAPAPAPSQKKTWSDLSAEAEATLETARSWGDRALEAAAPAPAASPPVPAAWAILAPPGAKPGGGAPATPSGPSSTRR